MKHSRILHYTIILLASSFTLWGCPKNAQVTAAPEASTSETPVAAAPYAGEQREAREPEVNRPSALPCLRRACSRSSSISINRLSGMTPGAQ